MTNLQRELNFLKENVLEMMDIVYSQMEKAKEVIKNADVSLANEILSIEKQINAIDISIAKQCENTIALYNPVASDLRFVLASIQIVSDLERLADHAEGMAGYVENGDISKPFKEEVLKHIRFDEMFDTALDILQDVINGFEMENTATSRQSFVKDPVLNKINKKAPGLFAELCEKKEQKNAEFFYLFSVMKKLERAGDLSKNIAEETIFYIEAKMLRHKKRKQKLK